MIYIENFVLLSEEEEWKFFMSIKRTCYNNFYPFQIFPKNEIDQLSFKDVTVLCGPNGSGKSTLLNIISEKFKLKRFSNYNKSSFFSDYVSRTRSDISVDFDVIVQDNSKIISSDDIFNFLQITRDIDDDIDKKRIELTEEYFRYKYMETDFKSIKDSERVKKILEARRLTSSKYVKARMSKNVKGQSNGQEAMEFFRREISENALYILDEPENSLSPKAQLELVKFIEESTRYFNCQFIISTHSPIISSIEGARIYDFTNIPFRETKWNNLEIVKVYKSLFK